MPGQTRLSADGYLTSLAACARALNGPVDWPDCVRDALAVVCDAAGVTRVWMFQTIFLDDTQVLQDHIFQHVREEKWAQMTEQRFRLFRTTFEDPHYRRVVEGRIRGEPAAFILDRLASPGMRANMISQKVLSMLTVPVMVAGEWWGTLGLDDCERMTVWSEDDITYLQTVAGLIAGAIHREQRQTLARQVTVMERFAGGGMWEFDFSRRRLWCSDTLFRMLGYPPPYPQMNVRRLARHLEADDRKTVMTAVRRGLNGARAGFRMDCRAQRLNGQPFWLELITDVAPGDPATPGPARLAGLVLEASERKARELELGQAALTDPLTGLPNRRAFQAHAHKALSERPGHVALLVLDIDHFKRINDTLGHAAGDEALRTLAGVLSATLREGDMVARMGGEEFAVLLTRDSSDALDVAERLRRALAQTPIRLSDLSGQPHVVSITVSIGLAHHRAFGGSAEPLDPLMGRADRALYSAKRGGRNRICIDQGFSPYPKDPPGTPPEAEGAEA